MAEEFWKAESGWVLLRVDDGLLPFNQETRVAKLIDGDEEARATQQRMLHDGVPVVTDLPAP